MGGQVQKPDTLTMSSRFNCSYHKYFNNKHLIPARGGQFIPVKSGQHRWLFHYTYSYLWLQLIKY